MAGNQYQPDPRQSLFLVNYLDTSSETFSNALQSALKAGYEQEYAENITHLIPDWLSEAIGDNKMVRDAKKALSEALNYSTVDESGKVDPGVGRLKLDASKLVLKGMRKDKYSERSEVTGKDGQELQPLMVKIIGKDDKSNGDTNRV